MIPSECNRAPVPGGQGLPELTLRGMLLGALITVIFTASNVYLGLKVGMTFASSIPAAVISMAVLRFFQGSNILENNMVQTQASSAGCLSSVIFVLPGMLMLGYWQEIPFWQTTLICAAGGCLGVLFTIPLRRAMVVESSLPYPEGIAAAEILRVGGSKGHAGGLALLASGGALSGAAALATSGLRVAGGSFPLSLTVGKSYFCLDGGFSMALLGAGFLVGIAGGTAILVGTLIISLVAIPALTAAVPLPEGMDLASHAAALWSAKARYLGVGCIAVAAIWTILTLMRPLLRGITMSMQAMRGRDAGDGGAGADLPPRVILLLLALLMAVIMAITCAFITEAGIGLGLALLLSLCGAAAVFAIGLLVSAACGYMAGLIGSSSSPISGISIIAVVLVALMFHALGAASGIFDLEGGTRFMTALTLFTVSVVVAISSIANDNLQDLKTGYLVGASPWRQQVALLIGCVVGALVISVIIGLLHQAYGFTGAMPREGMDPSQVLSAPQATMIEAIANGIFTGNLDWTYIGMGIGVGVLAIATDLLLRRMSGGRLSLPPLAVGIGMYLPAEVNTPIFVGAMVNWLLIRRIRARAGDGSAGPQLKAMGQRGTLVAAGLIVGESLVGVVMAGIIVASVTTGGSDAPLAIGPWALSGQGHLIGLALFALGVALLWRWARGRAERG
ncbi:MAG: oligopeptide transporter, OPT family [Succinivibrionaceae bacterium]|nr:oligopeptide transporter, OPT family [Succinivibrionaceae bacterium]